jgi:heavy metal sensor kinase
MKLPVLSIRARLLWWSGVLLACVLGGFGVTAYQLERTQALRRIDDELGRRLALLQDDWRGSVPPGGRGGPGGPGGRKSFGLKDGKRGRPERDDGGTGSREGGAGAERGRGGAQLRLSPTTAALFADQAATAFYYAGWTSTGAPGGRSANGPVDLPVPTESARGQRFERTRAGWREHYAFTEARDCVLVGVSLAEAERVTRRFGWWLSGAGLGVLAVGLGGTWWIAVRALQPVKEIGATARRIAAGNLDERIAAPDAASELRELADVLNSTFARLEAAFAEQRNFTADASHELRTPIAALVTAMQGLLTRERSVEEYRETVEACLRTVQQMRQLTESLLALARFDAGQETPRREPCDLADVVRVSVERLRPLAEQRKITLHVAAEPTNLRCDAERIAQVVTNLVANAIHYNREGGEVCVAMRADGTHAVLTVMDNGGGIAAKDLPQVFERFYRADQARSWSDGHSGLGLAICKAIVEAHGGTITAVSTEGEGSTFTVRLPD